MSEDLKIEVTECFVASILNEGKISQDIKSKLPREIAKRILKDKNAQKIILNAFLKLYPFVTGEISRYRRQSSQEKGNKALQEVPQMVYVKSENQFLINYRLIQEQVVSLKDMLANETLKHENTATKSINEIQKNETFHNERIIALLTDLSKYAPTTNPELQEISNDA